MSSIGRKIVVGALVLVGLVLAVWIGSAAYSGWQGYKWQKQTDAFQESLRRPYREDTYGGKTPEETWSMFLDALRKGDVELASKYFVVEKQEEWREGLRKIKDENRLDTVIDEIHLLRKNSADDNKAYYYYTASTSQFGSLSSSVIFIYNTYTKIWKISVL